MRWKNSYRCDCGNGFEGAAPFEDEALSCPQCNRLVEPLTTEPWYERGDVVVLTHQGAPAPMGDGLRPGEVADGAQVVVHRTFHWRGHRMVCIGYPSPRGRWHSVLAWVYWDQLAPLPEALPSELDEPTYRRRAH